MWVVPAPVWMVEYIDYLCVGNGDDDEVWGVLIDIGMRCVVVSS